MTNVNGRRADESTRSGIRWGFIWSTIAPLLLPMWFLAFALQTLVYFATNNLIGIDLAIYRHAAEVALAGGNPWLVDSPLPAFAGPPPTLLLYVPLTLLPLQIATLVMMPAQLLAAIWAIRRLRIPLWWLLFPPLFDALIVGNPDALVLPLLLVAGPLAGLAAVLKIYALVPLVLQRRWGTIVVAGAVSVLSLPQLPNFLSTLGMVGAVLGSSEPLSAWGTWFIVPVVVALWLLRRHGAEYLVVPALWPNTRSQYGTMSLVAAHRYPVAAALIGLNTPLLPPLAVIVMAVELRLQSRRSDVGQSEMPGDVRSTRDPDPAAEEPGAPLDQ
jgi:hypothetical protein